MSIYFISTLAEVNINNHYYDMRKLEYSIALHKILHYGCPVILIQSETDTVNKSCIESLLPRFNTVLSIPNTLSLTNYNTKSQKEFISIQQFIKSNPTINDNDWIIKTSGRYVLIDDSFYNKVKNAGNEIQGFAKFGCEGSTIYTFCFALRYKWFKQIFLKDNCELNYHCIEKFIVNCFYDYNIYNHIESIDKLGILINPDNQAEYSVL
jgi:hypothetical protein